MGKFMKIVFHHFSFPYSLKLSSSLSLTDLFYLLLLKQIVEKIISFDVRLTDNSTQLAFAMWLCVEMNKRCSGVSVSHITSFSAYLPTCPMFVTVCLLFK